MKLKIIIVALLFCLGLAFGSALVKSSSITPTSAVAATPRRYAVNIAYSAAPCWSEPRDIWLKLSALRSNLKTEYGGPATGDAAKQIEEIESLI